MTRLWGGRFGSEPAAELVAFTHSLRFDMRLAREDCAVLSAHADALVRADLLKPEEADAVAQALEGIAEEVARGTFTFEPSDEDIHTAVERALLLALPEVAPRVRAGLSRNDRVVTALRLWLLANGRALTLQLCELIDALGERAARSQHVLVPGYTHMQRAQPVTLSHHLLAHCFALVRDAQRLADALTRADESALGAGALAGSTLGLDPLRAARDLGFRRTMLNSLDAVSARDFVAEFLAASAILAVSLSRIGEELVLWSSREFGFAEPSDRYATGSSLMPQKKNPDVAELVRGKAGRIIGNLTGLLAMLKGLPLAYNRDLQEDKEPLFDTVDQLRLLLPALTGMIREMRFDEDAMASAASDGALLATDLAEHLVARGTPFRDAHEAVGKAVQEAAAGGRSITDLSLEELRRIAPSIGEDVHETLDARASVERRGSPGPSAESIATQLAAVAAARTQIQSALG